MITRALSDLVAGVSRILAVKTILSSLIIWCESWQLPVSQQAGPPNGSGWDAEWQTLRCFQTDLHSFNWNLFDICRLLASHKHIFAYTNNEKRHHQETIRLTEVFFRSATQRCNFFFLGVGKLLNLNRRFFCVIMILENAMERMRSHKTFCDLINLSRQLVPMT